MALGSVFFGESMFSRESDASKVALAHLARFLRTRGYVMIDCQMTTAHLQSMGAREMPRSDFCAALAIHTPGGGLPGKWPADAARSLDWR